MNFVINEKYIARIPRLELLTTSVRITIDVKIFTLFVIFTVFVIKPLSKVIVHSKYVVIFTIWMMLP